MQDREGGVRHCIEGKGYYKMLLIADFQEFYMICNQFHHLLQNKNPQDIDLAGVTV
jgi:hypothetical protein